MNRSLLSTSALLLSTALFTPAALADEATAWRLFVSDHERGIVSVVDAVDGDLLETFETQGPATLHRSTGGETVFAVQGGAGRVSAFASGIAFDDHGDHADILIEDARALDFAMEGEKPAHFVERQGYVAQWFDGETQARFVTERGVLNGDAEVRTIDVGAAHHGVAVPFADHAVVTIPNPDDASQRPVGARIVGFDGEQVGEDVACPGLHGSAGSGSLHALACHTGILLVSQEDGVPQLRHLAYADDLPEGSVSTVIGGRGLQYFIGNYGPDRLVVIDPSAEEAFKLVQLPTRRVHFTVDSVRPRFAYVVTEDGQLHKLDVLEGAIVASLRVTDPYSMDGHWSDPRPRLAVARDEILVTDPLKGVIHRVDAQSFETSGEIVVEGKPFNIVAVGGSGAVHGGAEGHDHDHDHSHDHDHDHGDGHDHSHEGHGHD